MCVFKLKAKGETLIMMTLTNPPNYLNLVFDAQSVLVIAV